jgi:predicted aminopeptidase
MVGGGEQYVASLLFHELAHQKLYVKDDSEFSEAFAMVIEELGTER